MLQLLSRLADDVDTGLISYGATSSQDTSLATLRRDERNQLRALLLLAVKGFISPAPNVVNSDEMMSVADPVLVTRKALEVAEKILRSPLLSTAVEADTALLAASIEILAKIGLCNPRNRSRIVSDLLTLLRNQMAVSPGGSGASLPPLPAQPAFHRSRPQPMSAMLLQSLLESLIELCASPNAESVTGGVAPRYDGALLTAVMDVLREAVVASSAVAFEEHGSAPMIGNEMASQHAHRSSGLRLRSTRLGRQFRPLINMHRGKSASATSTPGATSTAQRNSRVKSIATSSVANSAEAVGGRADELDVIRGQSDDRQTIHILLLSALNSLMDVELGQYEARAGAFDGTTPAMPVYGTATNTSVFDGSSTRAALYYIARELQVQCAVQISAVNIYPPYFQRRLPGKMRVILLLRGLLDMIPPN
jgi:hypothetical protein